MKVLIFSFLVGLTSSIILAYNGVSDLETEATLALLTTLPFGVMLLAGRFSRG